MAVKNVFVDDQSKNLRQKSVSVKKCKCTPKIQYLDRTLAKSEFLKIPVGDGFLNKLNLENWWHLRW